MQDHNIQRSEKDNRKKNRCERPLVKAMACGAIGRCPACGTGRLFRAYLKVADACSNCSQPLHHHQADDAPPYFTILILGHILVPLMIAIETTFTPPLWIHAAIGVPLTIVLTLTFLPITKGAVVALQWALYMHGFNEKTPT